MKNFWEKFFGGIKGFFGVLRGIWLRRRKTEDSAAVEKFDYLRWVADAVAVPEGDTEPFCTASQPPAPERQAQVAESAARLVEQLEELIAEKCSNDPPVRPLLESIVFYTQRFRESCVSAAGAQQLDFAVYKKAFTECLLYGITSCTMFLSNLTEPGEDGEIIAGALRIIGEHLNIAGVHTAPIDLGSCVDYGNYEVAYLLPADQPEKKEHIAAIISPAYYLGTSRLTYGQAACFE